MGTESISNLDTPAGGQGRASLDCIEHGELDPVRRFAGEHSSASALAKRAWYLPTIRRMGALLASMLVLAAGCGDSQEAVEPFADDPSRPLGVCERRSSQADGDGEQRANDPFAYDRAAPLEVRERRSSQHDGLTVHEVSYASPKGGRVPAFVVVPDGSKPFAGLIVQHGLPGSRNDSLPVARNYARLGAVVVAIDAPFARRPGEPVRFDECDRLEQIQLIADLRRAVDLLRARDDVDAERIAYFGISYGGAMGGLLAAVEDRIAAFVLAVGDGGLVEHFSGRDEGAGPLATLAPGQRRRWLKAMTPIEPLRHVARARAPLLFQSGRYDQAVPPADAERYHRAAREPKDIRWYDSGHRLPREAVCDAAVWLAEHIGIAGRKDVACRGAGGTAR